ncbi:MAG: DUF3127 domain-containing protein [Lutibacter sp.]
MEVNGKIKKIDETKTFGANNFRKRELILTTNEQYPQILKIEFIQDNCDKLNNFQIGDDVKIAINLKGREWQNPQGETIYFNSIQGWRIEKNMDNEQNIPPTAPIESFETTTDFNDSEPDDLPF